MSMFENLEESGTELSREDLERLEALFRKVAKDKSKGVELKAELDRLGVFEEYEDRFLDLFSKRGAGGSDD